MFYQSMSSLYVCVYVVCLFSDAFYPYVIFSRVLKIDYSLSPNVLIFRQFKAPSDLIKVLSPLAHTTSA